MQDTICYSTYQTLMRTSNLVLSSASFSLPMNSYNYFSPFRRNHNLVRKSFSTLQLTNFVETFQNKKFVVIDSQIIIIKYVYTWSRKERKNITLKSVKLWNELRFIELEKCSRSLSWYNKVQLKKVIISNFSPLHIHLHYIVLQFFGISFYFVYY